MSNINCKIKKFQGLQVIYFFAPGKTDHYLIKLPYMLNELLPIYLIFMIFWSFCRWRNSSVCCMRHIEETFEKKYSKYKSGRQITAVSQCLFTYLRTTDSIHVRLNDEQLRVKFCGKLLLQWLWQKIFRRFKCWEELYPAKERNPRLTVILILHLYPRTAYCYILNITVY